jgi:hypothetical protein
MLPGMATLAQKIAAEAKMRDLIAENGLPEPDAVEYGFTCIRLIWHEQKLAVVIDIDEPPEGFGVADG